MASLSEIVDISELLVALGKAGTATDPELGLLSLVKKRVESLIRKEIGIGITQATYTHILPAADAFHEANHLVWGNDVLYLPQYPVRSITSLYVDTSARGGAEAEAFSSDTLLVDGNDYHLDVGQTGLARDGKVIRMGWKWPAVPGSIKVTYVAGWSADELEGDVSDPGLDASAIKEATVSAVCENFHQKLSFQATAGQAGPLKSERLGDYAVTYDTTNFGPGIVLPQETKDMLRAYKRLPVG